MSTFQSYLLVYRHRFAAIGAVFGLSILALPAVASDHGPAKINPTQILNNPGTPTGYEGAGSGGSAYDNGGPVGNLYAYDGGGGIGSGVATGTSSGATPAGGTYDGGGGSGGSISTPQGGPNGGPVKQTTKDVVGYEGGGGVGSYDAGGPEG